MNELRSLPVDQRKHRMQHSEAETAVREDSRDKREHIKELAEEAGKDTLATLGIFLAASAAGYQPRLETAPYNPPPQPTVTTGPSTAERMNELLRTGTIHKADIDKFEREIRQERARQEQARLAEQAKQEQARLARQQRQAQAHEQLTKLAEEVGGPAFAIFLLRKFAEGFKEEVGEAAKRAGGRAGHAVLGLVKTLVQRLASQQKSPEVLLGAIKDEAKADDFISSCEEAARDAAMVYAGCNETTRTAALNASERGTRRLLRDMGIRRANEMATQTRRAFVTWSGAYGPS